MRRIGRKVTYSEAREILHRAPYGILSTVCDDRMPYGIPLSFVLTGNSLYFHCATEGQKLDNIRHDCRVCLTGVAESRLGRDHLTMEYASAMAFGTAHIVYAEDERQAGFRLLAGKYAPELTGQALNAYIQSCADEATVVRVEIEYIAGKANRGTATER